MTDQAVFGASAQQPASGGQAPQTAKQTPPEAPWKIWESRFGQQVANMEQIDFITTVLVETRIVNM